MQLRSGSVKTNYIMFKNLKKESHKYVNSVLCDSLAVAIFFIYMNMILNKGLMLNDIGGTMQAGISMALIAVTVFSFTYILYNSRMFVLNKKKEYEIYYLLGMDNKDKKKIFFYEKSFISVVSVLLGIAWGAVFSRIIFLGLVNYVGINDVPFRLSSFAVILTTVPYMVISIVTTCLSYRGMKENKNKVRIIKYRKLYSLLGIVIVLGAFIYLGFCEKVGPVGAKNLLIVFVTVIIGLAFTIFNGEGLSWVFELIIRKDEFSKMILRKQFISEMERNKKSIFVLSMSFVVVTFFISIAVFILVGSGKMSEYKNPYHLTIETRENLDLSEVEQFIESGKEEVSIIKNIEGIFLGYSPKNQNRVELLTVIKESDLKKLITGVRDLKVGECYVVMSKSQLSYIDDSQDFKEKNTLELGNVFSSSEYTYKFKNRDNNVNVTIKEIVGVQLNENLLGTYKIAIPDDIYRLISKEIDRDKMSTALLVNYSNWKRTQETVTKIRERYEENVWISSRIESYNEVLSTGRIIVFLFSFVGILFFIAANNAFFFKLKSDRPEVREYFLSLYRIGTTMSQMKKIMRWKIAILLFTPVVIGLTVGGVLMMLINPEKAGVGLLGTTTLFNVLIFMTIEYCFYLIIYRSEVKDVVKRLF